MSLHMTAFDEICTNDGDNECQAWLINLFDAKDEIVAFTASNCGEGRIGHFVRYYKGSFNVGIRIRFDDGGADAIIRFPKPGHTSRALRDEKVTNEIRVMDYIAQKTTIPLPRVISWGLLEQSPRRLGPFILMEFVDGVSLSSILKTPTENDAKIEILNPGIDHGILDKVYEQIADYMIQLSELDFTSIGSISKNSNSQIWRATGRPLTYNANELVTVSGYPIDELPDASFQSAREHFQSLLHEHLLHFRTQRNIAEDPEEAEKRFIARYQFGQLIKQYCIKERGPFKLFCDDFRPANMIVDQNTLRILAVLDFEFTNAMPAQFAYDPPWWLLLRSPGILLEHGSLEYFLAQFVPRMEQFLRAVERVETKRYSVNGQPDRRFLSALMRESWRIGRFWFDYGIRKSFDIDTIYWCALSKGNSDTGPLPENVRSQMDSLIQWKMEQVEAYDAEHCARFLDAHNEDDSLSENNAHSEDDESVEDESEKYTAPEVNE